MVARVLGAALIVLAPTLPGAVHPLAPESQAGTTWEEHRTNLERTIQEIESGQMLWVPDGPRLRPVRRDDYRVALIHTVLAPLDRATTANLIADHIPEPARMAEVARLARAAVASTEAFRRALREELVNVNNYLRTNKAVGPLVFDPRSAQRIREHLLTTWRLLMIVTDQSSEFRDQADILQKAVGSTLLVTEVTCQPIDPPKVNCQLAGRVNWRGVENAVLFVPNADRLVEELRMASLSSPGIDNSSSIRFRIAAGFGVGGNLDFSATLNAASGEIESGTISWAASGRSIKVGTWSAERAQR